MIEIESQREYAIQFVATLPQVFGESLDRMTLWDRIGSALETAHAKTIGDDTDFFVSQVLEHIKAAPANVAANDDLRVILNWLQDSTSEERHAWINYLATHRMTALVRGRAKWESRKLEKQIERNWKEDE